jgi:hypothetical protein
MARPYRPPSPPYVGPPDKHSGDGNKPITRVVLHGTVSRAVEGGARDIARYFRSDSAGGSAHYIVDPGEVVQSAYDSCVAWHAPPNPHSVGIEFCDMVGVGGKPLPASRWTKDPAHWNELRLGSRLVAELCLHYHVPVALVGASALKTGRGGICEHSDVSEAWHQSSHWDLGEFPRRRFLRMVKNEVAWIEDGSPTGGPVTFAELCPANRKPGTANLDGLRDALERRRRARRQDRSTDLSTHDQKGKP